MNWNEVADETGKLCLMRLCTGVVVIDDQPEVSIDDPSFLFESNEGFQEVTSRRTQKSKQKAALEEAMKKSQEQQAQAAAQAKRMEKEAKVQNVLLLLCCAYLWGLDAVG